MKVCYLTTTFPIKKNDTYNKSVYDLAMTMQQYHTIVVIAPGSADSAASGKVGGIQTERFNYFWPKSWMTVAYGYGIPKNLMRNPLAWIQLPFFFLSFVKKAKEISKQCDVLHAHWTLSGWVALQCKKAHNIPVIISPRGSDINMVKNIPLLRNITTRVLLQADYITVTSTDLQKTLCSFGIPKRKISIIPNGITVQKYNNDNINTDAKKYILYVGRLAPEKISPAFLPGIAKAFKQVPQLYLFIIGFGPLRVVIEKESKKLGIDDRIVFLGALKNTEVKKYMSAAQCLIVPSVQEGFGTVLIEAMSQKCPVIGAKTGGITDIITSQCGFVFPKYNDTILAKHIVQLVKNKKMRKKMSSASYNRVLEKYEWKKLSDIYNTLYTRLVEECAE